MIIHLVSVWFHYKQKKIMLLLVQNRGTVNNFCDSAGKLTSTSRKNTITFTAGIKLWPGHT